MTFWDTLGIEPSADINVIKRAYAARLKVTRPDDDAEAYQRLRQAYEYAQRHAARGVPKKTTANFTAEILTVKQGLVKETAEAQDPAQTPPSDQQVVAVVTASLPPGEPAGKMAGEPSSGAVNGGDTNGEQNFERPLAMRPEQPLQPPRRPLLIHHKGEQPKEDEPVKIVLSPASLVQATLQIWREHGAEKLVSRWPALQRELNELPLGNRATTSSLFAQLVIENDLPPRFVVNLARYFEWQSDFRVEQALGAQRAHLLGTRLMLAMMVPSRAGSAPGRPLHVVVFGKLVGSRPDWWLWIFSVLAGAQLPGQFLSMTDDERDILGISQKVKAEALVWLQRGMLVRAWLVVLVLAWSWSSDHDLLGPGQPANLVLYALPVAFAVFYLQIGVATELQRRWIWPIKRAEQISCCLAIAPALLAQLLRQFEVSSASWSNRISVWSLLATVLLAAAAVVAPPPSRQDTAQMRLPIQFVLTSLLCLLVLAVIRPAASPLILLVYASGWLGVNILIYEPSRRWMVGAFPRWKKSSVGRILIALAIVLFALPLALPAFPSLLKELARRSSQRLVFGAVALALFLPSSAPLSLMVTTRILLFAVVLLLINNVLRGYAFKSMIAAKHKRRWWGEHKVLTLGLIIFVMAIASQFFWAQRSEVPVNTVTRAATPPQPTLSKTLRVVAMAEQSADNLHQPSRDQQAALEMLQGQVLRSLGTWRLLSGTEARCAIEYGADGMILKYTASRGLGDVAFDQALKTAVMQSEPLKLIPNVDLSGRPVRRVDLLVKGG